MYVITYRVNSTRQFFISEMQQMYLKNLIHSFKRIFFYRSRWLLCPELFFQKHLKPYTVSFINNCIMEIMLHSDYGLKSLCSLLKVVCLTEKQQYTTLLQGSHPITEKQQYTTLLQCSHPMSALGLSLTIIIPRRSKL